MARKPPPATTEPTIRRMRPGEEAAVIALVARVFDENVAPQYGEAGVREFYAYAAPEPLAARAQRDHLVLIAEQDGALVGMIEMRQDGHVAMLFAEPQGRGIGRRLLHTALAVGAWRQDEPSRVTVHASPNAVAAYERLGFRPTDREQELNGIRFVPMELATGP